MVEAHRTTIGKLTFTFLVLACCWTDPVIAIGTRDDVPGVEATNSTNPYIEFGAVFDSVVRLSWETRRGTFYGTGTLVGSTDPGQFKILTAAHNVDGKAGAGLPRWAH